MFSLILPQRDPFLVSFSKLHTSFLSSSSLYPSSVGNPAQILLFISFFLFSLKEKKIASDPPHPRLSKFPHSLQTLFSLSMKRVAAPATGWPSWLKGTVRPRLRPLCPAGPALALAEDGGQTSHLPGSRAAVIPKAPTPRTQTVFQKRPTLLPFGTDRALRG